MGITCKNASQTALHARDELENYSRIMCENAELDISLGLFEDFSLDAGDVDDPAWDDVIEIKVENGKGFIAGSNERSILLGVYVYLKSAGCMWVRPGIKGEYIPKCDLSTHSFSYRHKADYRFRGEAIEGALKFENLVDYIKWMPKVGKNIFYMQFVYPNQFFRRWYEHFNNPILEGEHGNEKIIKMIDTFYEPIEKLIVKCGMILVNVGHSYLLEPYGIHYRGKDIKYEYGKDAENAMALVGGKRELFHGSPNFTQVCLSNDKVRADLVDFLADYAKKKPYMSILSVGMADSTGNNCECENCIKKTPSDWYAMFLNEVDERFTKEGITAKLRVSCYTDRFWPPKEVKIKNPDRFMMGLSLQRDYNVPLKATWEKKPLPKWELNSYKIKPDSDLMFSFLDAWKPYFDCKIKTVGDYDLFTNMYFDPGLFTVSKLIYDDNQVFDKLGVEGRSCYQTQRCAFPTAHPSAIYGESLFDKNLDFDSYTDKFFEASFGKEYKKCREYLEKITKLFKPDKLRSNLSVVAIDTGANTNEKDDNEISGNRELIASLSEIPDFVRSFIPIIEENMKDENPCRRESWRILRYHADYCIAFSEVFLEAAKGNSENALALYEQMKIDMAKVEDDIQPYFDLYLFVRALDSKLSQFEFKG